MALYKGAVRIAAIRCGGVPVAKIYKGSVLVFKAPAAGGDPEP